MKKSILILGGSSSIAEEIKLLHEDDSVYFSYHSHENNGKNAFYLDLYETKSYENIPHQNYDVIYSFLGYTPDVKLIEDQETSKKTIELNFLYPTLVLQYILKKQYVDKQSSIKIITSVAGIRGRKLNYVYGASKSGLQRLIEGLAHKYTHVNFTDVVLGPVYTKSVPLHKTPNFLISNPKVVAKKIKNAKGNKVYIPYKWGIIMTIIRLIPTSVYKKISF